MLVLHETIPTEDGGVDVATHVVERVVYAGPTDRSASTVLYMGKGEEAAGLMACVDGRGQYVHGHLREWYHGMTQTFAADIAANNLAHLAIREVLWIGAASGMLSRGLRVSGAASFVLEVEWDKRLSEVLREAIDAAEGAMPDPMFDLRGAMYRRKQGDGITTIYDDAFEIFPNDILSKNVFDAIFLDIDPNDPRFPALVDTLLVYARKGAIITAQADHRDWPLPAAFADSVWGWTIREDALGWRYADRRV